MHMLTSIVDISVPVKNPALTLPKEHVLQPDAWEFNERFHDFNESIESFDTVPGKRRQLWGVTAIRGVIAALEQFVSTPHLQK
ncbi:hypothetical protein [Nitrosospira multiformis]|uniref:Uncharacterized protein n=1 Tax=Nitrosospira multiformis (strain ATCC 25196 / NCIMB 11849 / C 71) TaxID=323848 RepID=A0A1H5RXF5_NITMU|nr:hypothetical protein [Nitrosospira multiformis]SDZ73496.1 hypothetical protein SAMN05216411_101100 [Nitrosospira multiformis]SEF42368.1 hypothetical protein SAMN05216403_101231 [Nitrosospira multiformis ATCC 25196]